MLFVAIYAKNLKYLIFVLKNYQNKYNFIYVAPISKPLYYFWIKLFFCQLIVIHYIYK